jgi:hypothetical protein
MWIKSERQLRMTQSAMERFESTLEELSAQR